jgi:hypothetical protein
MVDQGRWRSRGSPELRRLAALVNGSSLPVRENEEGPNGSSPRVQEGGVVAEYAERRGLLAAAEQSRWGSV